MHVLGVGAMSDRKRGERSRRVRVYFRSRSIKFTRSLLESTSRGSSSNHTGESPASSDVGVVLPCIEFGEGYEMRAHIVLRAVGELTGVRQCLWRVFFSGV